MHPILLDFKYPIYTYGTCVAAAFLIGIQLIVPRAVKAGYDKNFIMNIFLVVLASAIVGARILYVLQEWEYFCGHPGQMLMVQQGGLSYFGGFIAVVIASVIAVRMSGKRYLDIADFFAMVLPLGQAIGRIGCYFNGCCWGLPSTGIFSVVFPAGSPVWAEHVARGWIRSDSAYSLSVLPAQWISSILDLLLFCLLVRIEDRKKIGGVTFFSYWVGYGTIRFVMEFIREDSPVAAWGLTSPQIFSLAGVAVGIGCLLWLAKKSRIAAAGIKGT